MIKVLFFGRLRESLKQDSLSIDASLDLISIEKIRRYLTSTYGKHWERELNQENLIVSLNQTVVLPEAEVRDGDEVAFFPPMTGG